MTNYNKQYNPSAKKGFKRWKQLLFSKGNAHTGDKTHNHDHPLALRARCCKPGGSSFLASANRSSGRTLFW